MEKILFILPELRLIRFVFPVFLLLLLFPSGAGAQEAAQEAAGQVFYFRHRAGDRHRVLSTVRQNVFVNRRLSHSAEILNRISVEVVSVSEEGEGRHRAVFQTSERSLSHVRSDRSFQWAREYETDFLRDRRGRLTIDEKFFMPVVRNIPVLPERALRPGDSWFYHGHEVHDFRDSFGIPEPYRIPFTAFYTFLGERPWNGVMYPAFSVRYTIFTSPPAVRGRMYPRRIVAETDMVVFWDPDFGQPVAYTQTFNFIFELSTGDTIEFRGTAEAEIIESEQMDRERIAGEIAGVISSLNMEGVTVRVADEGVVISLDNIQFYADTDIMLPGELEKLDTIVEILRKYQERDILVGGHTALAGTAEGRQRLSVARAAAVADFIIARNARAPDRVVVRGYGAERPVADNATEEGRRRNRRVEIIILEN